MRENFFKLTPDVILQSVEAAGFEPIGECLQLNSYENRVFSVKLEGPPHQIIAKFYRPERWSLQALQEEHQFLADLVKAGVPAIAPFPLPDSKGSTLLFTENLWASFFPKARGRLAQDLNETDLIQIGKSLAHLHNIGAERRFQHRPSLTPSDFGWPSLQILKNWITPSLWDRYEDAAREIFEFLEARLPLASFQRIHGDCHRGNILRTDEPGKPSEFFFVDFDDSVMGPPVQDFWMLCLGDEEEAEQQLNALLTGYEEFRQFDRQQLALLEPLRGMRIIYYAAWIARRWDDPSFPQIFPQFASEAYWLDELQSLEAIAHHLFDC